VIRIGALDKAQWNVQNTWNAYALASHVIKHPELISSDAELEGIEYILPDTNGRTLRIDLVFEGMNAIYLVECESNQAGCIKDNLLTKKFSSRLEKYKIRFEEVYSGNKDIEMVLIVPLVKRGENACPYCGKVLDATFKHNKEALDQVKKTLMNITNKPIDRAYSLIKSSGPMGIMRQNLYREFKVSANELNDIIKELKGDELIIESEGPSTGGRRPTMYRAVKDG